jgi:hypothetical protein
VAQGHAAHYARVEQNATEQLRAELAAARKRLVEAARYQVGHTPVEREREREKGAAVKVILIGWQSVRQWSSFLSLRTDVGA